MARLTLPEPHPARLELVRRRLTVKAVADHYGCTLNFASRVLLGYITPPAAFKASVADLLGKPEDELFHEACR